MAEISKQTVADDAAIEILMDMAFGPARHSRSVWLLRSGPPVADLCLVLRESNVMLASLRFWEVQLEQQTVLLLGPLAVQPDLRGRGYGWQIVAEGLARAAAVDCDGTKHPRSRYRRGVEDLLVAATRRGVSTLAASER